MGLLPDHHIHPAGLRIAGVRIAGDLKARANPAREGYEVLPEIDLLECEIGGLIDLRGTRVRAISFENCNFGSSQTQYSVNPTNESLHFLGAEFEREVAFEGCNFVGQVALDFANLAKGLDITRCTFAHSLHMASAKSQGSVQIEGCTIGGRDQKGGSPHAFCADFSQLALEGGLTVNRCRFDGSIEMAAMNIQGLTISRCSVRSTEVNEVALNLFRAKLEGGFEITRSVFRGRIWAHSLISSSSCYVADCRVLQGTGHSEFNLDYGKIAGSMYITRSDFRKGLTLNFAKLDGPMLVHSSRAVAAGADSMALSAISLSVAALEFHDSLFVGQLRFSNCRIDGDFNFLASACKIFGEDRLTLSDLDPEQQVDENHPSFFMMNSKIGGYLYFNRSLVSGGAEVFFSEMASGAQFWQSAFVSGTRQVSLDLQSSTSIGNLFLRACHITSAVTLWDGSWALVTFEGCQIGFYDAETSAPFSLWASGLKVKQTFSITEIEIDGRRLTTRMIGMAFFDHGDLGDLQFQSCELILPDVAFAIGQGRVVDAEGAVIRNNVRIGQTTSRIERRASHFSPPKFVGAFSLDDAKISGDVIVNDCILEARGDTARPLAHFNSEERVARRKRGVALSLNDTQIGGELVIGHCSQDEEKNPVPMLTGLVDMRNANIGLISDSGGECWRKAGLQPGQLLLDGCIYRDLDDIHEDENSGTRRNRDAASKRLRWLELQYPRGKADPVTFIPQPYEQLASIFAAEGNDRGRRKVIIAKRDMNRKFGRLGPFNRAMQRLLKETSDYGYSPGRAIFWTVLYVTLGTIAAYFLSTHNALMLASTDAQPQTVFDPFVYAFDAAIPIIDLNQDSTWTINPAAFRYDVLASAVTIAKSIYEVVGMLLISVTILSLTGTLREKE
ncbi:hypothetical protein [Citromicrobium bathyomarinum]|uniref:hypothetical protein n=1 Tax=Citromicrobium bathyomarinum TaxID=72174 RepID=UPI003159E52F